MKKNIIYCDWLPPYYPKQPFFRFCSHFQIATIAQAKWMERDRKKTFNWWIQDILWFCTPWQLWKKINELFSDVAVWSWWTLSYLRNAIDQNCCIVLFIAHWYNQKCQWFNPIKGVFFQHYISVWWYDDEGFFIYDSSLSTQSHELWVWNWFIASSLLDRCRGQWWLWLWNKFFITVWKS